MLYLFHRPGSILCVAALCAVHWALPARWRNGFLLLASLAAYAAWDWRFLGCLAFVTVVNFLCGLAVAPGRPERERTFALWVAVLSSLGVLGIFKYLGFFLAGLQALATAVGLPASGPGLQLILPLGISFYTFQALSYPIDVWRGRMPPTRRFVDFALYVIYFPQLVAGPIERARDMLPQLAVERQWADVDWRRGLYRFAQGFALKVVVADPTSYLVEEVFARASPSGATVLLGLYGLAFQLYADFAGYSRMAQGIGDVFGIRLSDNFQLPFFATDYIDFFRRWNITLSSWIADYMYQPLAYWLPRTRLLRGIASTKRRLWIAATMSLLVTRVAFGLWHGAALTFVGMGLFIFAAQLVSLSLRGALRVRTSGRSRARLLAAGQMALTFHLFCGTLLFYRAESLAQARRFAAAFLAGLGAADPVVLSLLPYVAVAAGVVLVHDLVEHLRGDAFWLAGANYYLRAACVVGMYFMYRQTTGIGAVQFQYFQF